MSRSYKKTAVYKSQNEKGAKRQASKRVRKAVCGNGGLFKKLFEQWDICDWKTWKRKPAKKELSK